MSSMDLNWSEAPHHSGRGFGVPSATMQRYIAMGGAHRLIFMGAQVAMVVCSAWLWERLGEDRSINQCWMLTTGRPMTADICQVNWAPLALQQLVQKAKRAALVFAFDRSGWRKWSGTCCHSSRQGNFWHSPLVYWKRTYCAVAINTHDVHMCLCILLVYQHSCHMVYTTRSLSYDWYRATVK